MHFDNSKSRSPSKGSGAGDRYLRGGPKLIGSRTENSSGFGGSQRPPIAAERRCRLRRPVRDREERVRFDQEARILREVSILGRAMYLVQFEDGTIAFLSQDEIMIGVGDSNNA